jgi:hypothetical protein
MEHVTDGVYMADRETPGQAQFELGDHVLVNVNGMVNEPGTISLSYSGIWKDVQTTGTVCYWLVFDREGEMVGTDPRFRPSGIEAHFLTRA